MQLGLFAGGAPRFDERFAGLRRTELAHGAWIEHQPAWLAGADTLFAELRDTTAWSTERRVMYDREVDTPRLLARAPAHPLLERMREALSARYREAFVRTTMAWYRDGADSVAMHGDTTAR